MTVSRAGQYPAPESGALWRPFYQSKAPVETCGRQQVIYQSRVFLYVSDRLVSDGRNSPFE